MHYPARSIGAGIGGRRVRHRAILTLLPASCPGKRREAREHGGQMRSRLWSTKRSKIVPSSAPGRTTRSSRRSKRRGASSLLSPRCGQKSALQCRDPGARRRLERHLRHWRIGRRQPGGARRRRAAHDHGWRQSDDSDGRYRRVAARLGPSGDRRHLSENAGGETMSLAASSLSWPVAGALNQSLAAASRTMFAISHGAPTVSEQ